MNSRQYLYMRFNQLTRIRIALLSLALLFSTESLAMFNYSLFSEVRGVVVSQGKPVAGAVIERSYDWSWKEQQGKDQVVTDDKGEFYLSPIVGTAFLGWLPHQPMVQQTISIKHGGRSYDAWLYTKSNYRPNGELSGKPIQLYCSLEAPAQKKESGVPNRWVNGICELR